MSVYKHKVNSDPHDDDDDDDDVIILHPPKREKMDASRQVNATPSIRIEQMLQHDVWDFYKKNDGAFVMRKLEEDGTAAGSTGAGMNTANLGQQTGARPKANVQVFKNNLFTVRVNSPNREVHIPEANRVATVNHVSAQENDSVSANTVTVAPKDWVTLKTVAAPKTQVITINPKPATGNQIAAMSIATTSGRPVNAVAAPKAEVTIGPSSSVKNGVITINTPTTSKKDVITMKAVTVPSVITINTTKNINEKGALSGLNQSSTKLEQQVKGMNIAAQSLSRSSSSSSTPLLLEDPTMYSDEACRIQEMFPDVPLQLIANDLLVTGSVEDTIDNILDGKLVSSLPSVLPAESSLDDQRDEKIISKQQPKPEEKPTDNKKGTLIKIELMLQNEVWDIKKKKTEGYVMKKALEGDDSHDKNDELTSCNFSEPMEEESDELETAVLNDDTLYKGNPDEVNVPVKLMVYNKSKEAQSEGKLQSSTETENDHSILEEKVPLDSFEFSDDENEDGETVEHLLFKASLALEQRKHFMETPSEKHDDAALLKITGQVRCEEESELTEELDAAEAKEVSDPVAAVESCSSDPDPTASKDDCSDDEYYSDQDSEEAGEKD